MKKEKTFGIGEVIYGFLGFCGNESGNFVIVNIKDNVLNLVEKNGKHRTESINENHVRPLSKKIGIGFYYEDQDMPEFLSDNEISILIQQAEEERERIKIKEQQDKLDELNLIEVFKQKYSFLNFYNPEEFIGIKRTIQNVRQYLKHEYSGEKFNVHKDGYDTIEIECSNPLIFSKVRNDISIFLNHKKDESGDYLDYKPSVFNKCFGGVKFITVYDKNGNI